MKYKGLLISLIAGSICLPVMSFGQNDLSAWREKAKQGDATAQVYLGVKYFKGMPVPQCFHRIMFKLMHG